MAMDPVAWLVGGGAMHSVEVGRTLAYAATGGAQGVISPGDMKVNQLATPGSSVRVVPGGAVALSQSSGAGQQSYVFRNASETVVSIAATGSGSGRSDLIVARIEDPFAPGEPWTTPGDVTVGPYVFIRVISNVAPGTTTMPAGQTGVALARIDIPASTATITNAMITDLRYLARPRNQRAVEMNAVSASASVTAPTGIIWTDFRPLIAVPSWATDVAVIATMSGIRQNPGPCAGVYTLAFGPSGANQFRAANQSYNYVATDAGSSRVITIGGKGVIPTALRGTTCQFQIEATRASGTGSLTTDTGSSVIFDVVFYEKAS